jgi:hypothetical protein
MGRDSSVGIGARYGAGRRGFNFSILNSVQIGPTQHPIQWVPGVKRPRREADYSIPSSAEVKKRGA